MIAFLSLLIIFIIGLIAIVRPSRSIYADPRIDAAIEELVQTRNGKPLLRLIVDGVVKWDKPTGSICKSIDGRLVIEDDQYFYLLIDWQPSFNLADMEMSEMLECACINRSGVSRAVDRYTEYLSGKV